MHEFGKHTDVQIIEHRPYHGCAPLTSQSQYLITQSSQLFPLEARSCITSNYKSQVSGFLAINSFIREPIESAVDQTGWHPVSVYATGL
jgi:hypothetical protein